RMNLGLYSYLGAAIGFGFLAVLLLFSWRSNVQGRLLTAVVGISAIWAGLAAGWAIDGLAWRWLYPAFEILRAIAWYVLLLKLLEPAAEHNPSYRRFLRWALPLSTGFAVLLLAGEWWSSTLALPDPASQSTTVLLTGHVLLAIIGLSIIEQLFRNTSARHLWSIKYLYIGAGGIFAYDLYLYADALLFHGLDRTLWEARGVINLAAVPLLAVTAARNRDWSPNIFVSRDIVLNSTAILGGGLYLLVMAGAGYYLREFGGEWGRLVQALFFSLAVVLLAVVLFSGQLRSRMRVFLGTHFYKNKYDYRREWLHLTGALGDTTLGSSSLEAAIRVLGELVDARAGLLWLQDDHGRFENVAAWNLERVDETEAGNSGLVGFLENKSYVINLTELDTYTGEYDGLELPAWLAAVPRGWLIVPLAVMKSLSGFVVLANPLVNRSINWEDRDLLLTAGRQVASHLAVLRTTDALAQARQFEVFNRMSAYMVHDLKNIAAALELVARNADKHRHKPEFIEDALDTVTTASGDIQRLLGALRDKRVDTGKPVVVDLDRLVREVAGRMQNLSPAPCVGETSGICRVIAERGRLENVLTHLIDNARQATSADGVIELHVQNSGSMAIVEIRDDGQGMTADFVRNRLFRPFDTTRGNAGMGIGMYESREFIRQLGGDIQV
ncbi:MAG: XrtA/PEP-CTERM system histidine kinase PrsK, partial [Thiohalobacterales bacterium]